MKQLRVVILGLCLFASQFVGAADVPAYHLTLASLFNEPYYGGLVMLLNENDGRTLRELQVFNEDGKLKFVLASEKGGIRFEINLADATTEQVAYPFGVTTSQTARAWLRTFAWRDLDLVLPGNDARVNARVREIQIHFKPNDLLQFERKVITAMSPAMPPLNRLFIVIKGQDPAPILEGGLYSETEIGAGDLAKAKQLLSPHYEMTMLPGACSALWRPVL